MAISEYTPEEQETPAHQLMRTRVAYNVGRQTMLAAENFTRRAQALLEMHTDTQEKAQAAWETATRDYVAALEAEIVRLGEKL